MRLALVVASVLVAAGSIAPAPPNAACTNSIGMTLALIRPGSFVAARFHPGCPSPRDPEEPGRHPKSRWTDADYTRCEELARRDARPGFTVTIARPYYIGTHEVTRGEWTALMGTNPSRVRAGRVGDDAARHPVDSVTWDDAQRFVRALNQREETKAYRLPTEFEWEYAARAGAATDPTWDEIHELAWEQEVEHPTTHAVGTKKPNAWGLFDTLGNVWEWVDDYYNEKAFADRVPPKQGRTHVLKGGGFLSDVKNTVYSTHGGGPGDGFDVGFRIARDATTACGSAQP